MDIINEKGGGRRGKETDAPKPPTIGKPYCIGKIHGGPTGVTEFKFLKIKCFCCSLCSVSQESRGAKGKGGGISITKIPLK